MSRVSPRNILGLTLAVLAGAACAAAATSVTVAAGTTVPVTESVTGTVAATVPGAGPDSTVPPATAQTAISADEARQALREIASSGEPIHLVRRLQLDVSATSTGTPGAGGLVQQRLLTLSCIDDDCTQLAASEAVPWNPDVPLFQPAPAQLDGTNLMYGGSYGSACTATTAATTAGTAPTATTSLVSTLAVVGLGTGTAIGLVGTTTIDTGCATAKPYEVRTLGISPDAPSTAIPQGQFTADGPNGKQVVSIAPCAAAQTECTAVLAETVAAADPSATPNTQIVEYPLTDNAEGDGLEGSAVYRAACEPAGGLPTAADAYEVTSSVSVDAVAIDGTTVLLVNGVRDGTTTQAGCAPLEDDIDLALLPAGKDAAAT